MKRTNAVLMMLVLLILTGTTWFGIAGNQAKTQKNYEGYVEAARRYAAKEVYIDAIDCYKKALELDTKNYDLTLELADAYYSLNDKTTFVTQCEKAISIDNTKSVAYMKLAEFYKNKNDYKEAINILKSAEKVQDREKIETLLEDLKYKYKEIYINAEEMGAWNLQSDTNIIAYKKKGYWGMCTSSGSKAINAQYDDIGTYDKDTGVIPCAENGEYYYINSKGNRKLVADISYEYLGNFGSNLAPARRNGKYGYVNTKFEEKQFEYDFAGAFCNGVAAVKQGSKWGIIDSNLKMVTGFDYDEILVDKNGFCSAYEVIIAVQNGKYVFINKEGKKLTDKQFDGAKMAASNNGYIAVKVGDKWGFADKSGNMVIEAQYQEAESFAVGLAPVKVLEEWGYINTDNKMVIEKKYTEAKAFNNRGTAAVKQGEQWNMITLYEYSN